MTRSQMGFWLLLIGVLMVVIAKGYAIYQAKGISTAFADKWTAWATIGALAAGLGLAITYKKLAA
jgi:hypothetical protein